MRMWWLNRILLVCLLMGVIRTISSFQLYIGDCPIFVDEACNQNAIKFVLSMRLGNHTVYHHLDPFNPDIPAGYNVLVPLKVLVHGYGGLSVDSAIRNVSSAYQNVGYNVIMVNWEPLASLPCYVAAYFNTWHVGQCLAILAVSLLHLGISPQLIHVVGFSLGAHIAGFAGSNLKRALGYSFYRITGLDPALPLFATLKNEWKLDKTDADFVDIIHTSSGSFGKIEATGHVDFYVNGGFLQPFCYDAMCKYETIVTIGMFMAYK